MKSCPRCRSLAFDDLDTCFNCLYPFDLSKRVKTMLPDDPLVDGYVEPDEPGNLYGLSGDSREGSTLRGRGGIFLLRIVQDATTPERTVMIREGQALRIGRAKANDILFSARNISRCHAVIRAESDRLTIEDIGSVNGTFLAGHRIREKSPLQLGDEIRIGAASIRVCSAETSQTATIGSTGIE